MLCTSTTRARFFVDALLDTPRKRSHRTRARRTTTKKNDNSASYYHTPHHHSQHSFIVIVTNKIFCYTSERSWLTRLFARPRRRRRRRPRDYNNQSNTPSIAHNQHQRYTHVIITCHPPSSSSVSSSNPITPREAPLSASRTRRARPRPRPPRTPSPQTAIARDSSCTRTHR